ncbi:MAG TPA: ATP-binding cassette domain-containing protein [Candidatus Acetothermia bacterium]|nr:ATP-binding cassette domain-containing protein [Candidatus Acetothermia bacterium]
MGNGVVELVDVSAVYEGERTLALHNVSLSVERGEMVAIIGPNGAGKTTLLEVINGLLPITRGMVFVLGEHVTPRSHRLRQQIAYLPQDLFFPPSTPFLARDVVLMGRFAQIGPFRLPHREDRHAMEQALAAVGAATLAHRPIGRLSGGQQRKILLARVIARQPRVLLLDEPLTNLDPEAKEELSNLILRIHAQLELTTLFVSHDPGPLLNAADRTITVVTGRIITDLVAESQFIQVM